MDVDITEFRVYMYIFIELRLHGPRSLHACAWYNQEKLGEEGCTNLVS